MAIHNLGGVQWESPCLSKMSAMSNAATAPVRQNTIAAYLLQGFVDGKVSALFEALKCDAIAKATAARELIDAEAAKYRAAFDERYSK